MRKFLALAALVLGLASCQNEPEGLNIVTGGEVDTVVTVTLPEATRASSADSGLVNVDPTAYDLRYILEVYDVAGDVFVYRAVETKATNATDARTVTFPVRLIPERGYNFVVWADFVYKNGRDDLYYNTLNNTNHGLNAVTIADGKWVAMDEARDAYTAVEYVDNYNSGKSINLTLVRPFGKLRVITTDIEALKVLANNALPEAVKVTYTTDVYSGFNALTQAAVYKQGETTRPTFEYALDNAAVYRYTDTADSKMVLFTDYIFGTENGTIQFELTATYANGNKSTNNFNTEIPIVRNYLTTISGNILTDGNDIRVDITDDFENSQNPNNPPYYQETISSAAEFYEAVKPANAGKKYIVISALNLSSETISTLAATRAGEATTTTTIDLNGYTITVDNQNAGALITLDNGQTIVFEDTSANGDGKVVLADNSKPLFDATNATVVVEGGSVEEEAVEGNFFVNDGDEENAESSLALLQYICENGGEFTFSQDLKGDVTVIQKPGVKVVIDGNYKKFNGTIYVHSNSNHYADAALTIKNVNFETSTIRHDKNDPYFNFIEALENGSQRYSTNITVDGCTFNANGDAQNLAVGVQIKASKWAKVLNCTATNMHSLIQAQSCGETVEVKNCTITGKNGVAFKQVKAATVENTEIVANEYGIRFDGNTDNYGIIVKDCKVTAAQPFIVRKMTGANNTITLEGTNTLDSTREAYNIVITKDSDDKPYTVPTGTYTLTGAEGLLVYPEVIVVAEGVHLKDEAYCINNKAGMFWFANEVNVNKNSFSGKTVKLDANIDLNNDTWTPISQTGATQFKGTFDGQNYTISNLNINTTDKGGNYASGLFGWILAAKVKNVKIDTANITAQHFVGAIAGYLEYAGCTVENCHVANATIVAEHNTAACGNKVGGIVGYAGNADTKVKDCTVANSSIKADRDAGQVVGAALAANVENCSATDVTVTAADGCSDEDAGKNIRNEVIGRVL